MAGVPQKTLSWLYDVLKRVGILLYRPGHTDTDRNIVIQIERIPTLPMCLPAILGLHLEQMSTVRPQQERG